MYGLQSERRANSTRVAWTGLGILLAISVLVGCSARQFPEVVVYTSVDQPHSEPVLKAFEQRSGVRVRAIYDIEATKTTGLVSRLVAERDRPQADVFWSSEIAQTLWLKAQGVLTPYASPVAEDIPAAHRDPDAYWTGLGLRARILLVNTAGIDPAEYPDSILDLLDSRWQPGEVGFANPLFGTTATHAAALYAVLGAEAAYSYFQALHDQGARVVDGNSVVRDMVASGDLTVGLTDTDDASVAVSGGRPVKVIFPDQDGLGTLFIPNTVALVAGGPNPEQGRALIDFLVGEEVENMLIEERFLCASVRTGGDASVTKAMAVSWTEVAAQIERAKSELKELLLR
jgi:iron(III) transport system substrate-binding protein